MTEDFRNLSVGTVGDVLRMKSEPALTQDEIHELADELQYGRGSLLFTNLENKRAVTKEAKKRGYRVYSRTAHGSLLDPRYTVEGRMQPDRGFANDYKHFHPKLYVLEAS
jgi:hypothetical protein